MEYDYTLIIKEPTLSLKGAIAIKGKIPQSGQKIGVYQEFSSDEWGQIDIPKESTSLFNKIVTDSLVEPTEVVRTTQEPTVYELREFILLTDEVYSIIECSLRGLPVTSEQRQLVADYQVIKHTMLKRLS